MILDLTIINFMFRSMHDPKSGNRGPSNSNLGLFYCLTSKTYNYIDIPMGT
jgi:hypothetical protein